MIQARFVYENNLYGEWTDITDAAATAGDHMYPNAAHRNEIIAVQFRVADGLQEPVVHIQNWQDRSKMKNNGARKHRRYVPNATVIYTNGLD